MNTLYFDGGFSNGKGTYSFILNNTVIETGHVDGDNTTAEYTGLIKGVGRAIELGMTSLHILGDSRTVLHQLTGQIKVRKTHSLHREAMRLLGSIEWTMEWIPSRKNPADKRIPKG